MRTYMARLGDFLFGLDTAPFKDLQRTSGYRWEGKNRIGREPAQQFTGLDSDTITLTGVVYPHFRGGLGQIARMRQQAEQGVPLPFIYCSEFVGQYLGRWCIKEIDEGRISLVKYGDDDNGGPLPSALTGGFSAADGGFA